MVPVLLKPGLENFEHYFASVWDECECVVIWALFGIAFLWDWNENWLSQSCGHCWVFQICWHIQCSAFTASPFKIWNSSTRMPSPPLALFIVMLSKAHLPSHSMMVTMSNGYNGCYYFFFFFFSFYFRRVLNSSFLRNIFMGQTTIGWQGSTCLPPTPTSTLNVLNIFSYSFLAWNVFIKKSANNLAGLLFLWGIILSCSF